MISHISINNFAIIENLDIDFYDGLNIMTGETGAGKSIIIEAVSLALGSRADTAFIRSGKDKAVVQLAADFDGEEFVITRELSATGKNLCKVNGEIVTLAQLNSICKKLADIHGQYDHQSLLNPDSHIKLVDSYKKELISPVKESLAEAYSNYKNIRSELDALINSEKDDLRKRDFMAFELDEIQKAQLIPGEDTELEERISVLQNSEKIYKALAVSYELISGEGSGQETGIDGSSILTMLSSVLNPIKDVSAYSKELDALTNEYSDLYYRLEDLSSQTRELRDASVYSPEELDEAISRSELIKSLKNKYGDSIEEITEYADSIEKKLDHIQNSGKYRESLEKELADSEAVLMDLCEELSDIRKASAKVLEKKIQSELDQLNFKDSQLKISFSREDSYTADGFDKVEFLISANKGEELKPLSKIASGGEMSRIMLAFKKIIGDSDDIPTMIFDEIDSGISGVTASIVGKSLMEIAKHHQIICITHLPQIAAFGLNNYKISKSSDESTTYTTVTHLDEDEKIREIARLVGGINITDKAIENARELIEQSK